MAQYLYAAAGHTPTAWEKKGLAVACMTFIVLCEYWRLRNRAWLIFNFTVIIFSTKHSLRISNAVGIIKIITLLL
jgi:hypothetical protein